MDKEKLAILVDFDDTAAEQNIAELLLSRFNPEGLATLRQEFRQGRMNLRDYQEVAFNRVAATVEEMRRFIQEHGLLRAGFPELVELCRQRDVPLAIATNGLDFYVQALLDKYGLPHIPVFSVETRLSAGALQYSYPHAMPYCWEWGNCKCKVLDSYRQAGYRVLYAGDSDRSDLCPAARADVLFARHRLLEYCKTHAVPHHELRDFHDVVAALRNGALLEPKPGASHD
ncbi:MAG: MtnX-like HAD-IB family phosphatase [Chloroflexi bacterium]|nr:MtnX-like HAD-IB family phosphatase [Chloroflexota bacterium]